MIETMRRCLSYQIYKDQNLEQTEQLAQFLKFAHINYINPLIMIKQNIAFPLINIMSLYLDKWHNT